MTDYCRYEADAMRAAETGNWSESLREHVNGCEECSAAASVAPWMERFSLTDERQHILPDPTVLLLKARLLRVNMGSERVSRPMTIAQMSAYVCVAACWAALLTWKWAAIEAWSSSFTVSHIVRGDISSQTLSLSFFAILFVLSSATVMLALHTILAEE